MKLDRFTYTILIVLLLTLAVSADFFLKKDLVKQAVREVVREDVCK